MSVSTSFVGKFALCSLILLLQAVTSQAFNVTDYLGKTYYASVGTNCIKVDTFSNGTVSLVKSNPSCSKQTASGQTLLILSDYYNVTDNTIYYERQYGWTGRFIISEDVAATSISTIVTVLETATSTFEVELILPPATEEPSSKPSTFPSLAPSILSSVQPSLQPSISHSPTGLPQCFTELFLGQTMYLDLLFFCLKVELFQNGNISLDRENIQCTPENASNTTQVLTSFQSSTGKTFFFDGDWKGSLFFVEDMTATKLSTNILDFGSGVFEFEVTSPHCAFPSSVPSSSPSMMPSLSAKPSSTPSIIPSLIPTTVPSTSPSISGNCFTGHSLGETIFYDVGLFCLKVELNRGGNISVDAGNTDCTSENASTNLSVLGTYDYHSNKAIYYHPGSVVNGWTGKVFFTQDLSRTGMSANLITLDGIGREIVLEIQYQHCVEPSSIPSSSPSINPTDLPSLVPSLSPSLVPSSSPSISPSSSPSVVPSTSPSSIPSLEPTFIPSLNPTSAPTSVPSVYPTSIPSSLPSHGPSNLPSFVPSSYPSSLPSLIPTSLPSYVPTSEPSSKPSSTPSYAPTSIPSTSPSNTPTSIPSSSPSLSPSSSPSIIPTVIPSSIPSTVPSDLPSTVPSDLPSSTPSSVPSSTPSVIPSIEPSMSPTVTPSSVPSTVPSAIPSTTPSSVPSSTPSVIPSIEPSISPTVTPSSIPSTVPSAVPSSTPSSVPSPTPTIIPTVVPSSIPTLIPTSFPSLAPSPKPSSIPSLEPSSTPSALPTHSAIPSSSPSLFTTCMVEKFLGSTYYTTYETAFVRMYYKIELIPNGKFSVDTSTIDFVNGSPSNFTDFSPISTLSGYNDNVAIFEDSETNWSGNFTLKENPQLDSVEFEFILYDSDSMTFVVELFFPSCEAPSMIPSSMPNKI